MPYRDERAAAAAKAAGAVLGGERSWSLRPSTLLDIPAGTLLALASPNGATLATGGRDRGAGAGRCLRNARSVAGQALAAAGGRPIGVIAAGERWNVDRRPLRPCAEDLLGAGAIVAAMRVLAGGEASPEATAGGQGGAGRRRSGRRTRRVLVGRELIRWDRPQDVELAGELDVSTVAPVLVDGVLADVS